MTKITTSLGRLLRQLSVFAMLWCVAAQAAAESVLMVEQVAGVAGLQRNGKQLALQAGDVLQEQDLIVTDASGRVTLRFARHGFMDIGPDAEIGVERLPFAAYANDLKSVFSVSKGYLRVVWRHPQQSSNWPLYVYMAGHRISLVSGEYFFLHNDTEQYSCVAAGQLTLQTAGANAVEIIKPPSCTVMLPGTPAQTTARNPDDWISVRRSYNLNIAASLASPGDLLAPPLPVASGPVLATAALAESPSAAPIAIPPALSTPSNDNRLGIAVAPSAGISATALARAPGATMQPTISSVTSGGWALNIASYVEPASAARQAQQLRAAGYRVMVQPAQINGKTWYRVQVPGYGSEQQARTAAGEIKGKLGLQGIWLVKLSSPKATGETLLPDHLR